MDPYAVAGASGYVGGRLVAQLVASREAGRGSWALTERLPVMICPRWITTRIQPIAEPDLLNYLEHAPHVPPGIYEIGGPEATTYRDMIATYASVRGLPARRIIDVPVLTPRLSAWWVDLITPVDRQVSHSLIESLTTDVIVNDPTPAAGAFDIVPLGVAAAIETALADQAARIPSKLMTFGAGLVDGVYSMSSFAELPAVDADRAKRDLQQCGGDLAWYGLPLAWRLRMLLGRLFGERSRLMKPASLVAGADVDWWRVERQTGDTLVLSASDWFCGEAWLGYHVADPPMTRIEQVAALRPKGLLGLLYWRAVWPVHYFVFRVMIRHRARRATTLSPQPAHGINGQL